MNYSVTLYDNVHLFVLLLQELRENPIILGDGCRVSVEIITVGDGKVIELVLESLLFDPFRSRRW